jgi:acid phosphatase (class A)
LLIHLVQNILMKNFICALFIFSIFSASAAPEQLGSIKIFSPAYIKKLLGPYPVSGSAEAADDFQAILNYQDTRSDADCALAAQDERVTVENLFAREGGPLTKIEAMALYPVLLKVYAEAGANIQLAKSIYKRPRPYLVDENITPCISLEKSYAYPSGHTTIAQVLGHVLSRFYPERKEAIMKRADEISTSRILGGVHHPSDIIAGKKLADALAQQLNFSGDI